MKSAEQSLLESLDTLVGVQNEQILIPLSKINQQIAQTVTSNAKTVNKLISKVIKGIHRHVVDGSNALDAVNTTVLQGLNQWLLNQEYMLTSLAHKSGDLPIGSSLSSIQMTSTDETPQVTYAGTLVLELSKLEPLAKQLVAAIRDIAARMPAPVAEDVAEDDLLRGLLTSESTQQGAVVGVTTAGRATQTGGSITYTTAEVWRVAGVPDQELYVSMGQSASTLTDEQIRMLRNEAEMDAWRARYLPSFQRP